MREFWKRMAPGLLGCGMILLPVLCVADATGDTPLPQEATQARKVRPAQVTGTQDRITLSADHAEALSVLKLVFAQAQRQFAPDGDVSGEVTLSLRGQTLSVVLEMICRQLLLRYEIDSNGIYRFHHNERALSEALARIQLRNSLLNAQGMMQAPMMQLPGGGVQSGGFGGGSFGGGASMPRSMNGRAFGASPNAALSNRGLQADANLTPFDQLMSANGLVGVHIPKGHPVPVVSVLEQFSRQSNQIIRIDPQLQENSELRIDGDIVRPLPGALAFLATVAHLEYYYFDGPPGARGYFVTTAPDFRIFYGLASEPAATFPPRAKNAMKSRQMRSSQQAAPASSPQADGKQKGKP